MKALMKSELRKLFTTRTTYLVLVALAAIVVLQVIVPLTELKPTDPPQQTSADRMIPQWLPVYVGLLLLGIRSVTEEFRYGTITPTLLVRPQRVRLIAAKGAVLAMVAGAFTVIAEAITFAIAVPWIAAGGGEVVISTPGDVWILAASPLAAALFAAMSVGVGAIVRNDVAAVAAGLIWILILETLIGIKWPGVFEFLPGQVAKALSGSGSGDLAQWAGGLVLALYALAGIVAGALVMTRRDVA